MWFTIRPASISLASAFLSPAERLERSTSSGAGAKRAAIWLSSSVLGNEFSAEAGAGVFWAVAMMVDTSRNIRSRSMGVDGPRGKGYQFRRGRQPSAEHTEGRAFGESRFSPEVSERKAK